MYSVDKNFFKVSLICEEGLHGCLWQNKGGDFVLRLEKEEVKGGLIMQRCWCTAGSRKNPVEGMEYSCWRL